MKKYIALLIIIIIIFIYINNKQKSLDNNIEDNLEDSLLETEIDEKVQSFMISGLSSDGNTRWEVEGESADIFLETVNMHKIKATSRGDNVNVSLAADEGTLFKESKDVELKNNVVINTDEGTVLKTQQLKWLANEEKIITDCYVNVLRDDVHIEGTGATAKPNIRKVQLEKDIKMSVKTAKQIIAGLDESKISEPTVTLITCDGPLEIDYQSYVSYFKNNVVIKDSQGSIFADEAIAYIDPDNKRIYKAMVKGNVKIIHQQNISYSDEAVYLVDEKRTILSGRPKVIIYSLDNLTNNNHLKEDDIKDNKNL